MEIRYYGNRTYCIGILDGHGENLRTLGSATELHKKLGDILTAAAKAKAAPPKHSRVDRATDGEPCMFCEDPKCKTAECEDDD